MIYNVIKPNFKDCTISYIDTDSCIFETSEDPYEQMKKNEDYFDLSVYPTSFFAYSDKNKGKLGTFKDEFAQDKDGNLNLILDFVALRSKCYSVNTLENVMKKCKGISKNEIEKFTHLDFLNANLNNYDLNVVQNTFRSKKHRLYTISTEIKGAISNKDDKRMQIDEIYTVPLGYKENI